MIFSICRSVAMETAIKFLARKSAKNQLKLECFFVVKLNISWIKLLVAHMHFYMGINNHICQCGKRKNEFDIYFITIMFHKSGWRTTNQI